MCAGAKIFFDLIIVNHNSTDYLLDCLQSVELSLTGEAVRIYVEDNGSTDGIERVYTSFPQVRLSINSVNKGYARSVNDALKKCRAPYIVLLNPDTRLFAGFFENVRSFMVKNRDVGVLGPKVLNRDGSVQGSARSFPTPLTAFFGRNSFLTHWFPNNPISRKNMVHDRCDGKFPLMVDWVSGACMVLRKEALDQVGFMDERFFMYWEDVDLCGRMWRAGWKVVYFPRASVIHHVGGSSEKRLFQSVYEFHKSCWRLVVKNAKVPPAVLGPIVLPVLAARLLAVSLFHMIRLRKNIF